MVMEIAGICCICHMLALFNSSCLFSFISADFGWSIFAAYHYLVLFFFYFKSYPPSLTLSSIIEEYSDSFVLLLFATSESSFFYIKIYFWSVMLCIFNSI